MKTYILVLSLLFAPSLFASGKSCEIIFKEAQQGMEEVIQKPIQRVLSAVEKDKKYSPLNPMKYARKLVDKAADFIQVYVNNKSFHSKYYRESVVSVARSYADNVGFELALNNRKAKFEELSEKINSIKEELGIDEDIRIRPPSTGRKPGTKPTNNVVISPIFKPDVQIPEGKNKVPEPRLSQLHAELIDSVKENAAVQREIKLLKDSFGKNRLNAKKQIFAEMAEFKKLEVEQANKVDEIATLVVREKFLGKSIDLLKQAMFRDLSIEPYDVLLPSVINGKVVFDTPMSYADWKEIKRDHTFYRRKAASSNILWRLGAGMYNREVQKINDRQAELYERLLIYRSVLQDYHADKTRKLIEEQQNTLNDLNSLLTGLDNFSLRPTEKARYRLFSTLLRYEIIEMFDFRSKRLREINDRIQEEVSEVLNPDEVRDIENRFGFGNLKKLTFAKIRSIAVSAMISSAALGLGGPKAYNFTVDTLEATQRMIVRTSYRSLTFFGFERENMIRNMALIRDESEFQKSLNDYRETFYVPIVRKLVDPKTSPEERKQKWIEFEHEINLLMVLHDLRGKSEEVRRSEDEFFNIVADTTNRTLQFTKLFSKNLVEFHGLTPSERALNASKFIADQGHKISADQLMYYVMRPEKVDQELDQRSQAQLKRFVEIYIVFEENLAESVDSNGALKISEEALVRLTVTDYMYKILVPSVENIAALGIEAIE